MDFGEKLSLMISELNKLGDDIYKLEEKTRDISSFKSAETKYDIFQAHQKARRAGVEYLRSLVIQIDSIAPETAKLLDEVLNLIEKNIKKLEEHYPKRQFFNKKEKKAYQHYLKEYIKNDEEAEIAIRYSSRIMIETFKKVLDTYNKYQR